MPDANCQKLKLNFKVIAHLLLLAGVLISSVAYTQFVRQTFPKPTFSDHYLRFTPNMNSVMFSNNGAVTQDNITGSSGWRWLSAQGHELCYTVGVLWGGKVNGEMRVGGSDFLSGLQGGKILPPLLPSDTADPRYRIYHIRGQDALTGWNPDYNDYPIRDGAPADAFGKPKFLGDEQLWYVSNDLDTNRLRRFHNMRPIGIEVQTTAWAYTRSEFLSGVVFVQHLIINKSADTLSDAYLGLLADWDIGDAEDDLIGCDTTLQLCYGYNGTDRDPAFGVAPAVGVMVLRSPVIRSPNDTAIFHDWKKAGFRYCDLTGHVRVVNASSVYGDPCEDACADGVYNWLRGFLPNGNWQIDPTTGKQTHFSAPGNPVTKTGWLDDMDTRPGNKRSFLSCGPFTLAAKDTQQLVYALLVRRGRDRIESVKELLEYAEEIRRTFRRTVRFYPSPIITVDASYPNINSVRLGVNVIDSNAISMHAVVMDKKKNVVLRFPLFDDGEHRDDWRNDNIFADDTLIASRREGVDVYVDIVYPEGETIRWFGRRCIPLAGPVRITGAHIESDHINQDRKANPGEHLRITLDVKNETIFTLDSVFCATRDTLPERNELYIIPEPFTSGATVRRSYSGSDVGSFLSVMIPSDAKAGDKIRFPIFLFDSLNNCWSDTIAIDVFELRSYGYDSLLLHIAGNCNGTLGYRMIDTTQWKGHSYKVRIQDISPFIKTYSVLDLDEARIVASSIPLPNHFAHDSPTIDGFRITQGTIRIDTSFLSLTNDLYHSPSVLYSPNQYRWFNFSTYGMFAGSSLLSTSLGLLDLFPVKLIFSSTRTQTAAVYLRGSKNYDYSGVGTVPFQAFDISDPSHPRQINVAFVEQPQSPGQDYYWMSPSDSFGKEELTVFKSTYSPQPDSMYTKKNLRNDARSLDIVYRIQAQRWEAEKYFHENDTLFIAPSIPISARDTFLLKIDHFPLPLKKAIPSNVFLSNIFPNPVTTSTTIEFGIPEAGQIAVSIFNALGKNISTLRSGWHEAGTYSVQWTPASSGNSGLYFCRLDWRGKSMWKKILLLK